MKNVLIAALLGGLTVFVTGFVLFAALALQLRYVRNFEDPGAVAKVLVANAPEAGTYYLPSAKTADGARIDDKELMAAAKAGPWAMVSIRPHGVEMDSMMPLGLGFLIEFLAALIAACVLRNLRPECGYACRVATVAALGAFAGLVGPILNWNFLFDAAGMSFFTAGAHLLTWLVGGLVIAKLAVPKP